MGTAVVTPLPTQGAGFYVDATNPKYAKHYNMLTHVTVELPKVIQEAGLPIVRPRPCACPSAERVD